MDENCVQSDRTWASWCRIGWGRGASRPPGAGMRPSAFCVGRYCSTDHSNITKNIETQLHTFQQQHEAITKRNNETHKSDIQHISNEIKQTNSETKQFLEQSIQELRNLILNNRMQCPRSPLSPLHKKNRSSTSPASTNTASTYSSNSKSYVNILAKDLTPSFDATISKSRKQQE